MTVRLVPVALAAALPAAGMAVVGAGQSAVRPQINCNECTDQVSASRGALRAACRANRGPEIVMVQRRKLRNIG